MCGIIIAMVGLVLFFGWLGVLIDIVLLILMLAFKK